MFCLMWISFFPSRIRLTVGLAWREASKHVADADWLKAEVSPPTPVGMPVLECSPTNSISRSGSSGLTISFRRGIVGPLSHFRSQEQSAARQSRQKDSKLPTIP
ncbi:hypothetical protein TNCV_1989481 [Trichonephila clavipes]|nr:hypothetical protein TNCV_1989481 [Trichonephila clavipes]